MKQQRIMGILLIVLSLVVVYVASQGTTLEDKCCDFAVIFLPLGVYALFTKKPITYVAQAEAAQRKKRLEP